MQILLFRKHGSYSQNFLLGVFSTNSGPDEESTGIEARLFFCKVVLEFNSPFLPIQFE